MTLRDDVQLVRSCLALCMLLRHLVLFNPLPGVLTKPDRIPSGEEPTWLEFIQNEKEPLDNNWYCVRQPSSLELQTGLSWIEARQHEDSFFKVQQPWAELEPTYQVYLGTMNLVSRLSSVLSDLISMR